MPKYKKKSLELLKKERKRKRDSIEETSQSETTSQPVCQKKGLPFEFLNVFKVPQNYKIPKRRTTTQSNSKSTEQDRGECSISMNTVNCQPQANLHLSSSSNTEVDQAQNPQEAETTRETETRKNKRLDTEYKEAETTRETETRKNKRLDTEYKEAETTRETETRKNKRLATEYKEAETKRDTKARKNKRLDVQFKKTETARETETRKNKRLCSEYKEAETTRETETRKNKRLDTQYKEAETTRETETRKNKRLDTEYKEAETKRDTKARKNKRLDLQFKKTETARETETRKNKRLDSEYKEAEQIRESKCRRDKRLNCFIRHNENKRESALRRCKRLNSWYKRNELLRQSAARRKKRLQLFYRRQENLRERIRKKIMRKRAKVSDMKTLIAKFHKTVSEGPVHVCTSCQQLWYKHSVSKFKIVFSKDKCTDKVNNILEQCPNISSIKNQIWICNTCKTYIKKGKIPPASTMNKMAFTDQGILKDLNPLELTLLSIMLQFMKIHQEPRGKQKFIQGNLVLVPANVANTVTQLPRLTTATATIKATLKRRLKYRHHVYCLNIRPELVRQGAQFLSTTPLYKEHNITIDTDWTTNVDEEINESSDEEEQQPGDLQEAITSDPAAAETKDDNNKDDDEDAWSEIDENELMCGQADTLLTSPDFVETSERDFLFNFAPGEGNIPVSIFMQTDAEELAFPGIFCGNKRIPNKDRSVKVTYGEIVKSELRNVDRRAAKSIENIFFKTKKIQMKTLIDQTQLAVRKVKTKDAKLTAKDVRGSAALDLVHQDKAYKFLANIRGSPPYFEKVSKELFSLIRQLGPFTFFVTLSAAETRWSHILKILGQVVDGKIYTDEEINNFSWQDKCRLIQSDPVTCARHFDYSAQKFISSFLLAKEQPLGHIQDYFYRIEYQQRGSPHVHMMVLCSDAPKFGQDSNEEVCRYIDKFITCHKPDDDSEISELIKLQTHKHTTTCRKKGKKNCRFGYPKPPMTDTVILCPLEAPDFTKEEILKYKQIWKTISKELDAVSDDETSTLDTLLQNLNLDKDTYIKAIRSSIHTPTVFLKRTTKEVRINSYNTNVLKAWRANLDVQYILDVYACATYVASYITKSQRGMSELLRKATIEAREGNQTLKEQIKTVGNKFLNAVELGAQEAVYICLQLPMKKSSRQTLFLNTSPPDERVTLLKPSNLLNVMKDDDEDIECSNILTRYSDRPSSMDKITLAEFAAYYDAPPAKLLNRTSLKKNQNQNFLPEPTFDQNDDEEEVDDQSHVNEISKGNHGPYKRRKVPRIIRSVHFNIDKEPEKYYRELLMLYSPWRNEQDIHKSCSSFYDRYKEIKDQVETERKQYEPFGEIVDEAQRLISENPDLDDAWDELAPHTESQNAVDIANKPKPKETGIENYDIGVDLGLQPSNMEEDINTQYELPDNDFRQHMRKLNKEQMEFVYDTIHALKTSDQPIYRFLSGGAGVGKSYVTKALYQLALKFYNKQAGEEFSTNKILLMAPTGKAAYHIHGNTIHSALKLAVNQKLQHKPLSSSALNTLRSKIGQIKLIFIDEISMVGFNMFNCIHQRLMEVTQKKEIFGGISVIAVGDLFQLKPVMDSYIFSPPNTGYLPLASNLWQDNFTMYELHEIMRQADSKPFAQLLNRLREGNHTSADISVLRSRIIDINLPSYPWDSSHLFTTNDKVDAYNTNIIHRGKKAVHVIKAKDNLIGSAPSNMKSKILESFKNNKENTKQLCNILEAAEGVYYEITLNLDTSDGLINGALCRMMKIETCKSVSHASGILWVQFEDPDIGKQLRNSSRRLYKSCHKKEWTPLEPSAKTYAAGSKGHAQIQRFKFPLRPSHAKTVHRSQGDTLSKVVADLSSNRRVDHIHYVAISRVQTLDGLFITNVQENKIGVDNNVKREMERLRDNLMQKTIKFIYELEDSHYKIYFLNACSLNRHIEDTRVDYNIQAADFLCFAETRFTTKDSLEDTKIIPFNQFRQDSQMSESNRRPAHGIAIYSKHLFQCDFPSNESFEGIEIAISRTTAMADLAIINVYKPPNKPTKQLCELLLSIHKNTSKIQK